MVVAIHCKRWNNIFPWSCSQQKSQNHGTITATKNYVARMAVSLWWRSCFVSFSGSLTKAQAEQVSDWSHIWNHFALPKYPFEPQVWQMCKLQHNPDIWYILHEAVSIICTAGIDGSLVGRAIFKVMGASTSKFVSMHGLCYRWGCCLLKWESYMHMDQVITQKITVNDHE